MAGEGQMDITRRDLTKMTGTAAALALTPGNLLAGAVGKGEPFSPNAWHQRLKRIMQLNFTEHDAADFNLDEWINYLVELKSECTYVSITNNVAFYPTKLPDLPVSRWLNGRDILGECVKAAKKHNIRIAGRLSIDTARVELSARHPDWFRRRKDGSIGYEGSVFGAAAPGDPSTSSEYGPTCSFSSYYDDFVPKLIDEVMTRYDLDGVYTNGWPGSSVQACYCVNCQKIGDPNSEAYRKAYQKRIFDLWALYNKRVMRRNKEAIFSGNLGSATQGGTLDLKELTSQAVWMFADNQGRHEDDAPSWDAAQQGRISQALIGNRPVVNSTGAWFYNGTARWRTTTANGPEVRTRLFQTLATGGTMHLHWLGMHQGFREDRRWQEYGREVFPWQAANDAHFHNISSLANVGLVVSPLSNRLYKAPTGTGTMQSLQGAYKALTEARIAFDTVLDSNLLPEKIAAYDVLILPNVAMLSNDQVREIRAFVDRGGSLLTTFETGLYDETGADRSDFALADLFGMHKQGARIGYGIRPAHGDPAAGSNFMQRIEQPRHPILAAFRNTNWIQGGAWRVPITADGAPLLTLIPQYAVYPVEAVFTEVDHTSVPMMVAREKGRARIVHLVGDNEAGYWRSAAGDLGDLFIQSVQWLIGDRRPIVAEGDGLLELYGWKTEPGYALHFVNHTNPNFRLGAFRRNYPVGAQTVRMTLADAKPVRAARLLRAGVELPFRQNGNVVEFTVPAVNDYEVAALEL
jgi:hypothetical protein